MQFVRSLSPDVVASQEVSAAAVQQITRVLADAGLTYVVSTVGDDRSYPFVLVTGARWPGRAGNTPAASLPFPERVLVTEVDAPAGRR